MEESPKHTDSLPQLRQNGAASPPPTNPEAAALGLSLTPQEVAQLAETLDPSILALLALC